MEKEREPTMAENLQTYAKPKRRYRSATPKPKKTKLDPLKPLSSMSCEQERFPDFYIQAMERRRRRTTTKRSTNSTKPTTKGVR